MHKLALGVATAAAIVVAMPLPPYSVEATLLGLSANMQNPDEAANPMANVTWWGIGITGSIGATGADPIGGPESRQGIRKHGENRREDAP